MNINKNSKLEETKKLNQQSAIGGSSVTSSTNDADLQEAKQLNQQSSSAHDTNITSNAGINMTSSISNADLQETKQLNEQSRKNKR